MIGTYAYFITSAGRNEEQKLTIKTGTLSLTFEDNDEGLADQIMLGESRSKEFRIRNTGTEQVTTNMLWSGLVNTYIEESLSYTLEYKTSEDGDWQTVSTVSHTNIPQSERTSDYNLATGLIIPSGVTYYYKLTITFNNLVDVNQEADKTAILSTKFKLGNQVSETKNIMMVRGVNYNEKIWAYNTDITTIIIENVLNPKENATYTFDLADSDSEGEIKAYLVPDSEDSTKYICYIQAAGKITANENSSYLFYDFSSTTKIIGLENLETSKVTNMMWMFNRCHSLTSLDLSSFDTSNVTNMVGMFFGCHIKSLNLSNFNTKNVIDMHDMFGYCTNLTSLDLSNFDTSKVNNMQDMFSNCSNLTELNISKFNISSVTNFTNIFNYVPSTINITVGTTGLRDWCINASNNKLTTSNFMIG